jgi:hypothetical protein
MKRFLILWVVLFWANTLFSQGLNESISNLASDIAQKVSKKNKVKLTLADFVTSEGKVDPLCEYIRKDLELKLINADNLQILDRKHLAKMLEENHLQSQGLIDESVVKSSVGFSKIEGLVLAEITYVGTNVNVKVTVTDINTSLMYAAASIDMPNDATIKNINDPEIKVCTYCGGKGSVQVQTVCNTCKGAGNIICQDCRGSGRRNGMTVGSYITCEGCGGKGKYICQTCLGKGKQFSYETCPKCHGKVLPENLRQPTTTGIPAPVNKKGEVCMVCYGTGKIETSRGSCGSCGGTGQIVYRGNLTTCSYCSGSGTRVTYEKCRSCNGTGKL